MLDTPTCRAHHKAIRMVVADIASALAAAEEIDAAAATAPAARQDPGTAIVPAGPRSPRRDIDAWIDMADNRSIVVRIDGVDSRLGLFQARKLRNLLAESIDHLDRATDIDAAARPEPCTCPTCGEDYPDDGMSLCPACREDGAVVDDEEAGQ
jgi:hypothetical protein